MSVKDCPKCKSEKILPVKGEHLLTCLTCAAVFHNNGAIFIPAEKPGYNKAATMSYEGVSKVLKDHKVTPAEAAMMQATIFEIVTDAYQNGFREGLLTGTKQNLYNLSMEKTNEDTV